MNVKINDLLNTPKICACGLTHQCNIDRIIIEKGAVNRIFEILSRYQYKNIVLVSDTNTYRVCGEKVLAMLKSGNLNVTGLIYKGDTVLVPDEKAIARLSEKVYGQTDVIIGVGSGVINDLCKYVSYKTNLPYIIIPTAPSMDGYASVAAAMIINRLKVTYNTHVPKVILCDIDILKNAPMDMVRAGFGDMLGKISALNDWKLSHLITGEVLCAEVYGLVEQAVRQCIDELDSIMKRNEKSIQKLMEGLIAVGIAMSYMNNSRPASGSEHHLSHFYEVISIMRGSEYFLHGIDVAFSTAVTCGLRHRLAKTKIKDFKYSFDAAKWQAAIKRVYGDMAQGVFALQERAGLYSEKNFQTICDKWDNIKVIILQVPTYPEITALLQRAGLDINDFYRLYRDDMIQDSINYAKDLKDRYTLFRLLQDVGLLEKFSVQYRVGERFKS